MQKCNCFIVDDTLVAAPSIPAFPGRVRNGAVFRIGQREEPLSGFKTVEFLPKTNKVMYLVPERSPDRGGFTRVKFVLGANASSSDITAQLDQYMYEGVDGGNLIAWSQSELLIDLYGDEIAYCLFRNGVSARVARVEDGLYVKEAPLEDIVWHRIERVFAQIKKMRESGSDLENAGMLRHYLSAVVSLFVVPTITEEAQHMLITEFFMKLSAVERTFIASQALLGLRRGL